MYIKRRELKQLKELLRKITSLDPTSYKERFIERRIAVRMNALGLKSFQEYLEFIRKNPDEVYNLFDNLTINVSLFFRDPLVWSAAYRKVLKPLIEYKRSRNEHTVRIWSAGCARGEEPYSISILLYEALGPGLGGFTITIFATDIDPKALEQAEKGEYVPQALDNVPRMWLRKHFVYDSVKGVYRVKPHIKRIVKFMLHDVVNDPPLNHIDIIFCRYLLIYFSRETQQKALMNFLKALREGGYLILGSAEFLPEEMHRYFEVIDLKARIYKKVWGGI
ncbi:MAG: protein-glutamate O-methyltransferase CheR [Thermoprotei archaeon]|nr:MAG: protein-glutamate O-methyltransferase CheR [Thermoprotei archaeon]